MTWFIGVHRIMQRRNRGFAAHGNPGGYRAPIPHPETSQNKVVLPAKFPKIQIPKEIVRQFAARNFIGIECRWTVPDANGKPLSTKCEEFEVADAPALNKFTEAKLE